MRTFSQKQFFLVLQILIWALSMLIVLKKTGLPFEPLKSFKSKKNIWAGFFSTLFFANPGCWGVLEISTT
jgi:hypothetical protein